MRIAIIGGPRSGKSTLAQKMAKELGYAHYCSDPLSLVKDPLENVTYLPEGLEWGRDSEYICSEWFKKDNCIIEGVGVVRALRKSKGNPVDKIIFLDWAMADRTPGQESMALAVRSIWSQIEERYKSIV